MIIVGFLVKITSEADLGGEFFFFKILSSIWIYKLLFSRIVQLPPLLHPWYKVDIFCVDIIYYLIFF